MFKRILIALSMFLVAGSCFAQSGLVMYDAEGDRVGTVLEYTSNGNPELTGTGHVKYTLSTNKYRQYSFVTLALTMALFSNQRK